ncbi:MAG: C2 family cysteine protease [Chloroflexota bacterium]
MKTSTGSDDGAKQGKRRESKIHRQAQLSQPETETINGELGLSRQPSQFVSRQPSEFLQRTHSSMLTRSHQRSRPEQTGGSSSTGILSTGTSNITTTHPQPNGSTVPPLSLMKVQRTSTHTGRRPMEQWRGRLDNHESTNSVQVHRKTLDSVIQRKQKNDTQDHRRTIIQRIPVDGKIRHPKGGNRQVKVYGHTGDNDALQVNRDEHWQLQHNTVITVDLDKRDQTQRYVQVIDELTSTVREGYTEPKFVRPDSSNNPAIHEFQKVQDAKIDTEYAAPDNQKLFKMGSPKLSEVKQGLLGDCYFVSVVANIVEKDKSIIKNMMTDHGDRVSVRFYHNGDPLSIVVSKDVPIFTQANERASYETEMTHTTYNEPYAHGALWMMLLEKAYAVFKGSSYANLEGGTPDDVYKDLLNIDVNSSTVNLHVMVSADESKLPWLTVHKPDDSSKDARAKVEYKTEVAKKRKLAKDIFGENEQAKVDRWMDFIKGRIISVNNLDALYQYLNRHENIRDLIPKVMRHFSRNNIYSGYSGSGIYAKDHNDIFDEINRRLEAGQYITAGSRNFGTDDNDEEIEMHRGIVSEHAYTVVGTKTSRNVKYIKLRNPFGRLAASYQKQNNNTYSRNKKLIAGPKNDGNGSFDIELTHFLETFDTYYAARPDNDG